MYKMHPKPEVIADQIFVLFEKYGNCDYIGENVTQLEHAVQCAMMAEKEDGSTEAVLGALLHDIGHLIGMDKNSERMVTGEIFLGVQGHEVVGEKFMSDLGIPASVSCFSRGHVDAKRYLTFKQEDYYEQLSEASKMTLVHQGGRMTAEEARAFEEHPQFGALIKMRSWDEKAKIQGLQIRPLKEYRQMFEKYLENNFASS